MGVEERAVGVSPRRAIHRIGDGIGRNGGAARARAGDDGDRIGRLVGCRDDRQALEADAPVGKGWIAGRRDDRGWIRRVAQDAIIDEDGFPGCLRLRVDRAALDIGACRVGDCIDDDRSADACAIPLGDAESAGIGGDRIGIARQHKRAIVRANGRALRQSPVRDRRRDVGRFRADGEGARAGDAIRRRRWRARRLGRRRPQRHYRAQLPCREPPLTCEGRRARRLQAADERGQIGLRRVDAGGSQRNGGADRDRFDVGARRAGNEYRAGLQQARRLRRALEDDQRTVVGPGFVRGHLGAGDIGGNVVRNLIDSRRNADGRTA